MTRSSRSQVVAEWMQQQIRDGKWSLNSRIPTEAKLAETLEVGRSTIREATRALANTGMLESVAGIGTFVRARSPVNAVLSEYLLRQPVSAVLGLRRALEVEAAGLAAGNRTDEDLERMRRSLEAGSAPVTDPASGLPSPGSFHADMFAAAGNPVLAEFYQCAIVAMRYAMGSGHLRPGTRDERAYDHRSIFDAIVAGDPDAARAAAAAHADRDFALASVPEPTPAA
ncbi:FCD domain-containing protein [Phytohabitans sp. ZYX-F-186]|uniref:FCD domain-containing protein n=1 Tax=Phytohabitans maris TaxID=3071409 RepID=A0ABU0Z9A0_9ACTN|nr:FCD domain-containing protein [Phytohabitans sp. ZYX-F-186]MDQ7903578.1 FCD domain-containing protein [Phytohabitans sp. ZYX-F-186]